MSVIAGFSTWFTEFTGQTVSAGYIVALALVCLLNYAVFCYRNLLARMRSLRLEREVSSLEHELQGAHRAQLLARLETDILREFLCETELDPALEFLLKRFVPNSADAFSIFVQVADDRTIIRASRGLSASSRNDLTVDPEFLERLSSSGTLVVDAGSLQRSQLWANLDPMDRRKVKQLYLLAIGDGEQLRGVLVATRLYPAGSDVACQLELGQRLMGSVASAFERSDSLESHRHELRFTTEMLELRKILDRHFESPMRMMEEFLDKLCERTGADRGALFLAPHGDFPSNAALVRRGKCLQQGVRTCWQSHEKRLAEVCVDERRPRAYDQEQLRGLGITTLLGSAIVAPLLHSRGVLGSVCLTRQEDRTFSALDRRLLEWAAEGLSDTMFRVYNHAAIERRAREDGLTELANRRTFDERMLEETERARESGTECALLLIDLDHFKSINDTYGHPAGDEVLRATSQILRNQVAKIRSSDRALIARYGGEEFAILLPEMSESGAQRIAEGIRAAVDSYEFSFGADLIHVTASCGISLFPRSAETAEDLLLVADAALYDAKDSGRNRARLGGITIIEITPV